MGNRLPCYLRTYRRRSGLTQGELDFLLGSGGGSKTCRYEGLSRIPELASALALQVVFDVPVHELFPGILISVEDDVINRAHQLIASLQGRTADPRVRQKLRFLYEITARGAGPRPQ